MKKIFSFAALLFAAMSLNAQIAATCAEAAAAMPAQSGDETQDTYIVTGYITNTNGAVNASNQQTFYMDDEKGTKKTLQGYLCVLPEGEDPLNVGDLITLTGKVKNYRNSPEIEKGTVTILERTVVNIDTIDVNVCDAIEIGEALNASDYTDDVFMVYGRLKGPASENTTYHYYDGEMACGEKIFKPYHCYGEAGLNLGKGDSVVVIGKLFNYNGNTIEISGGKIELIERYQGEVVIIEATVAEATEAALALANNAKSEDIYAVTGYIDSIAVAYDDTYKNISFFMTDDLANPTYDFEAFRVKCTADDAVKLIPGAKVTVTAQLQHYYKAATEELPEVNLAETVAGGTFVFADAQGVEAVRSEATTRKRIENGQLVIIRDGVKYNALGTVVK